MEEVTNMASLGDVLVGLAYLGAKKGIEKLSKGKISSDSIDAKTQRYVQDVQKRQEKEKKELENKYNK